MKQNRLAESDLDEKSVKKFEGVLKRLHKHNLTTTQAKKMSIDELRIALDSKASDSSMKALKRNINSMTYTKERKRFVVDTVMKKEIPTKDKELKDIRREYQKTAGNVYFAIVDELNKNYTYDDKRDVYLHAKKLLKPDEYKKVDLDLFEREVLDEYETP